MPKRELNIVQVDKLCDIEIEHPTATVVAWFDDHKGHYGPVVNFGGKGRKYVNHNGRVNIA